MSLKVLDGDGNPKYLAKGGAGTVGDPYTEPAQAVTVAALPLPSGAATSAAQTTAQATLAAIQAAAEAIKVAVETLDNAIGGTEMQVDVLTLPNVTLGAALPAGGNAIGTVGVTTVTLPTTLYNGKTTVTTAGTAVALAASQALVSGVTLKALASNTGIVYVGGSTVAAANGFELAAGEQVFLEIANLSTLYVDASANGQAVTWVAS